MGLRTKASLLVAFVVPLAGIAEEANRTVVSTGPVLSPATPSELAVESAIYLQRRLGVWLEDDAHKVLGASGRRRDALEKSQVTGTIVAFPDPTGRYREFELLFDHHTKTLRAVYIYPWAMTWSECRQLWGEDVNTTQLARGAVFRSYRTRHLDVLTDRTGNVINLGIY